MKAGWIVGTKALGLQTQISGFHELPKFLANNFVFRDTGIQRSARAGSLMSLEYC